MGKNKIIVINPVSLNIMKAICNSFGPLALEILDNASYTPLQSRTPSGNILIKFKNSFFTF